MTPTEYIENCLRTEPQTYRFQETNGISPRLEHSMFGLVTEVGEFADALKRAKIYGKAIDKVNLAEELGDILWYMSLALKDLGLSYEQVMDINIAKLKARFPDKYTDDKAINRDLATERKLLEDNTKKA